MTCAAIVTIFVVGVFFSFFVLNFIVEEFLFSVSVLCLLVFWFLHRWKDDFSSDS